MKTGRFIVIQDHTSEYPAPITFARGASLTVGEKYDGPEDWDEWYFCTTPGQAGGWVPAQIIRNPDGGGTVAGEDYTARELNVITGDIVTGCRKLNGWIWCERADNCESGWIPLAKLREMESEAVKKGK